MSDADPPPPRVELLREQRVDRICDDFEQGWLAEGPPPKLEDFLGQAPPSEQAALFRELLLLELDYRGRRRETVSASDLVRRFPDYAELIRRLAAPKMAARTHLAEGDTWEAAPPQGKGVEHDPPLMLGDYELLERLGVGGMGVVYRAWQRSARRAVALKVIRAELINSSGAHADSPAMERFRTEAQAAARLEHEGIVTVYEVGEVDGQPFFSMRLVDGRSLGEILADGPLENRRAARYVRDVSRALQEAHSAGILHRDLKPQNVLVDAKTDRALVADFGLAKRVEDRQELTRHGELMGTPQYMAPEQARDAASVTALADIYAIGATLYHLLTGRPPFLAATAMDTIQQLIQEDPPPPRGLNRAIDRDLETVCLKCLEKDPARRYGSAELLADELDRYLRSEPIKARRIGPLDRLVRWSRRKPAVASLSAAAAICLVAAVTAIVVGYVRTEAARRASESGFVDAQLALDQFVGGIRDEEQLNRPELRAFKEQLLRKALRYYETFLAKRADDPSLREEVAATYYRVGLIHEDISSADQALDAYHVAERAYQRLVKEQPTNLQLVAGWGDALNAIGRACSKKEQLNQASQAFGRSIEVRTELLRLAREQQRPSREFQRILVNSYMNLGIIEKRRQRFGAALKQYEIAQQMRLEMMRQEGSATRLRRDLGIGYYNIGHLALTLGQRDEAERNLRLAVAQLRELATDEAEQRNTVYTLAVSLRLLGDLENEYELAKSAYQEAEVAMREGTAIHPEINRFQEELALIHMNVGQLEHDAGELANATSHLKAAESILLRLRAEDLATPSYRRNLALSWQALGRIQLEQAEMKQARLTLEKSIELFVDLARGGDAGDREALEETRRLLAEAER